MNGGQWGVVVEEHIQDLWNGLRWAVSRQVPAEGYEHAVALAYEMAVHHVPNHPKQPRSRSLFRMQDGSWLVHVQGATFSWHFRVSVAQYYGTFPGVPQADPA